MDFYDQSPETSSSSGGALGWINGLSNLAGTIAGAVRGPATTSTPKAAASTTPSWLMPVALIGGALVLVVVLFSAFRK